MGKKFHVAVFCSDAAFIERQEFYSGMFGAPYFNGPINEGMGGNTYDGSIWERPDIIFGLLKSSMLTNSSEQLAHVGYVFDNGADFDAEIQRRGIDKNRIKIDGAGRRQIFVQGENGPNVEWEFSCLQPLK